MQLGFPSRGITGQNMMSEGIQAVIDIAGSIEEADIKEYILTQFDYTM